jgi:hypothetical protein
VKNIAPVQHIEIARSIHDNDFPSDEFKAIFMGSGGTAEENREMIDRYQMRRLHLMAPSDVTKVRLWINLTYLESAPEYD